MNVLWTHFGGPGSLVAGFLELTTPSRYIFVLYLSRFSIRGSPRVRGIQYVSPKIDLRKSNIQDLRNVIK